MILEEATYEAFRYLPKDLTLYSNKRILATCDECGKVRITSKNDYHVLCKSCCKKGVKLSEEHKCKLSESHKGAKFTEEHKSNIREALKGDKHYNWKGGISFEPYCVKFNDAFKEYIRAKFGYKCFLCSKSTKENGRKLDVHHVNYNKDCGCDGDKTCNFVPLCISCHMKTNGNRDYWQKLITDKLHRTIIGWNV